LLIVGNAACEPQESGAVATISENLNIHIPQANYQTLLGSIRLWVNFEFVPSQDGEFLWKLSDYGEIKE